MDTRKHREPDESDMPEDSLDAETDRRAIIADEVADALRNEIE